MQVFVKLPTGKTIILGVEASYTVYAVKVLIQGKSGVPLFDQRLIFAGAPLEDDHTLRNYNIQDKAGLEMTLPPAAACGTRSRGSGRRGAGTGAGRLDRRSELGPLGVRRFRYPAPWSSSGDIQTSALRD